MILRPKNFDDVIGQSELIDRLKILVSSAQKRNAALPHILFDGPPGLGKTTLALVLSNELGTPIQIGNGANLRSIKTILPYLMRVEQHSILFIDEIHRLTRLVEEFIYPAMEDFRVDLVNQRMEEPVTIDLPEFTLIGATTLGGALARPFYDRFQVHENLNLYSVEDLTELVLNKAQKLNLRIDGEIAHDLAKRSRGTPRIAQNLLIWLRDVALSKDASITLDLVQYAMTLKCIDEEGLTNVDKRYLDIVGQRGPIGLDTLSDTLKISRETLVEVVEPFLIERGMINKTTKGRVLCQS